MISSIAWVPKGIANPNPKRYEMSAVEAEMIEKMQLQQEEEAEQQQGNKKDNINTANDSALPADLRMDEYSSDEEEDRDATIGNLLIGNEQQDNDLVVADEHVGEQEEDDEDSDSDDDLADVPDTREFMPLSVDGLEAMGLTRGGADMYGDGDEDYEDASDAEDVRLCPNDAILVVAKTEEDFASLEVHVYEEDSGNLFVHHDVCLPSFPLALAHGDLVGETCGNYCAVGTFSPNIEIWNLDVLNALEPTCVLGQADESSLEARVKMGQTKKKSTAGKQLQQNGGHADAVMSLGWNKVHRQVLASGSADFTVKLWDVTLAGSHISTASSTLTHHSNKVASLQWHPTEGTLLATGSYDKTVALVDARSSDNVKQVKTAADVEAMAWDPFAPHLLTVASEDGTVTCWDVRKFQTKTPQWSFVANEYGGVSDLSYNAHVPGMMVSCAIDKTVTLWDTHTSTRNNGELEPVVSAPHACGTKDMGVGKLHTTSFYPSSPWLLACGGGGNEVAIWDLSRQDAIQNRFGSRVGTNDKPVPPTDEEEEQETNFEAVMAANDAKAKQQQQKTSKKKKKGKQKKAHRKGR